MLVEELVDVHISVHEILPRVQNHHGYEDLQEDHLKRRLWLHRFAVIPHQLHKPKKINPNSFRREKGRPKKILKFKVNKYYCVIEEIKIVSMTN